MKIRDYQAWLQAWDAARGWDQVAPAHTLLHAMEELGEVARVIVARDIRHHTDFLDQLRRDFWLAVLAAALLTAVVGLLVARRGLLPVRAIAHMLGIPATPERNQKLQLAALFKLPEMRQEFKAIRRAVADLQKVVGHDQKPLESDQAA